MELKLFFATLCFFLLMLLNVEQKPTYNPFDENYKVSVETLLKDSCKLLYQPCGYKTYGKEIDNNLVYYQYNPNEEKEACSKGICIYLDTFILSSALNTSEKIEAKTNELLFEKVDSSRIISALLGLGVSLTSDCRSKTPSDPLEVELEELTTTSHSAELWCFQNKKGKIFTAAITWELPEKKEENQLIIRKIEFFCSRFK